MSVPSLLRPVTFGQAHILPDGSIVYDDVINMWNNLIAFFRPGFPGSVIRYTITLVNQITFCPQPKLFFIIRHQNKIRATDFKSQIPEIKNIKISHSFGPRGISGISMISETRLTMETKPMFEDGHFVRYKFYFKKNPNGMYMNMMGFDKTMYQINTTLVFTDTDSNIQSVINSYERRDGPNPGPGTTGGPNGPSGPTGGNPGTGSGHDDDRVIIKKDK